MSETNLPAEARPPSPALPSIAELWQHVIAADVACNSADKAVQAASARKDLRAEIAAEVAMARATDQGFALRQLIATMHAASMADAAVQLRVALEMVEAIAHSEPNPARDPAKMRTLDRMLKSAVPIAMTVAGIDVASWCYGRGGGDATEHSGAEVGPAAS